MKGPFVRQTFLARWTTLVACCSAGPLAYSYHQERAVLDAEVAVHHRDRQVAYLY